MGKVPADFKRAGRGVTPVLTMAGGGAFKRGMTKPDPEAPAGRTKSPAAERALAEAAARRAASERAAADRPKEASGPKGLEPTRYGDWERKGIASDF
jgi:hypothetical protein